MPTISPSHKAITAYYTTLAAIAKQGAVNEQATRLAFTTLLDTLAKPVGWTLILEQALANRKRPDGTLYDGFKIPRGFWEAKDTGDDLDAEIRTKIARGYPLSNTIFENTRRAVLYQNGRPVLDADITTPAQLAALLDAFFAYTGAQIAEFQAAVTQFQHDIPELARGLLRLIADERLVNPGFVGAFTHFETLCRAALNPNIATAAIEEMLVQHLLTERLFRTVFNNPDFTRRNAIATEIEKVIDALTSRAFSRQDYLRKLDYFYLAIEDAARTISDFAEKQTFLNTVYERFFQGFSRDQADTHGVVYTPQPIVDWMWTSVEAVLGREFASSLATPGVQILDPATGTGNFIVNLLRRLGRRDLKRKYAEDLFANEVMLLPYYIAALNIEHEFYELSGGYAPFEGIAFADTLDMAESPQLLMFSEENTERVERQRNARITVIVGNPPYNVGQLNENDNNKNRKYPQLDRRVAETYAKDSRASNKNALSDVYVKFFRWASDRLRGEDGIVCYVTNNSFVDQIAFDGMRKQLLHDFTTIYHLDLHGNVRKNPKLSGTTHNVFGIQVGVGITLAIRNSRQTERRLHYYRVPEGWRRDEKLGFLATTKSIDGVEWQELQPDARNTWLTAGHVADYATLMPIGSKETKAGSALDAEAVFKTYSLGVSTARDDRVYDFDRARLADKVRDFIDAYNAEVDRWQRRPDRSVAVDAFVSHSSKSVKWSESLKDNLARGRVGTFSSEKLRSGVRRPFCKQWLYFDRLLNERVYQQPDIFPTAEAENTVICVPGLGNRMLFGCLITSSIPSYDLAFEKAQCFPFYVYDEDGGNRCENITDWALARFREAYGPAVTKHDIFHYVYALLHHPEYRARYGENLKRELPRLPLVAPGEAWAALVAAGARLAALHLQYEAVPEYPLRWVENNAVPFSWRVERMRLTPDKTALIVNGSLRLEGVPPEALRYRLGNRSALEWVIDQYQVSTDKRSGIVSDPNRADDEEYIVRLVGRVVGVSVDTVAIVGALPALGLGADVMQ